MRAHPLATTTMCFTLLGLGACSDPDEDAGDYVYEDAVEALAPLPEARFTHTATTLLDGRVLIIGGTLGSPAMLDEAAYVAEVDLYDPETRATSRGAALEVPRTSHSATLLSDGRVVVLGGATDQGLPGPAYAVEVWDPSSESFTTVSELDFNLIYHCAAATGDDELLILDDCSADACTAARLDPDSGALTALGGLPRYRYTLDVDCAPLPDGRVVLAGGIDDSSGQALPATELEIYDPGAETFEAVGPLAGGFGANTRVVAFGAGEVLIVGDALDVQAGGPLAQVYSSASGELREVSGEGINRIEHLATPLADGRVLISGGRDLDASGLPLAAGLDVYDPATDTLSRLGLDYAARFGHAAARLHEGPVLLVGGRGDEHLAELDLFY